MTLVGKVAIVTGGARGIGFACVERFLAEGAKVVLADIDATAARAAMRELEDAGHEALFVECDVGDRLDVQNLAKATLEAYGFIDIVVNSAGIQGSGDFLSLKEAEFERVLHTNLNGAFLVCQIVAREMVAQVEAGRAPGVIINMSASAAVAALPGQIPCAVSKAAVTQLTESLALALAPHGIRVNAIGPGSIAGSRSIFTKDRARRERLVKRIPLGRLGEPREIAAIAAFLASEDASYITGQTIYADGGRLTLRALLDSDT